MSEFKSESDIDKAWEYYPLYKNLLSLPTGSFFRVSLISNNLKSSEVN
ncbi:MAG: hypothetical protein ACFE9T_00195 [Promethearchaeota archaeon]